MRVREGDKSEGDRERQREREIMRGSMRVRERQTDRQTDRDRDREKREEGGWGEKGGIFIAALYASVFSCCCFLCVLHLQIYDCKIDRESVK